MLRDHLLRPGIRRRARAYAEWLEWQSGRNKPPAANLLLTLTHGPGPAFYAHDAPQQEALPKVKAALVIDGHSIHPRLTGAWESRSRFRPDMREIVVPFRRYNGSFNRTELATIRKVFDQLCAERRLAAKDREQRDDLAVEVVRMFQDGAMSEDELWRAVSKRRGANR